MSEFEIRVDINEGAAHFKRNPDKIPVEIKENAEKIKELNKWMRGLSLMEKAQLLACFDTETCNSLAVYIPSTPKVEQPIVQEEVSKEPAEGSSPSWVAIARRGSKSKSWADQIDDELELMGGAPRLPPVTMAPAVTTAKAPKKNKDDITDEEAAKKAAHLKSLCEKYGKSWEGYA